MIYLQKSPTPTVVHSLWCVLLVSAGGAITLLHALVFRSPLFLWSAWGGIGLLLIALWLRPTLALQGYVWMVKLQRGVVLAMVRKWLMSIAFFGIISIHRAQGPKLDTAVPPDNASLWRTAQRHSMMKDAPGSRGVFEEANQASWPLEMLRWIRTSRCSWLAALIPFMALMHLLEVDQRKAPVSSETYTLY